MKILMVCLGNICRSPLAQGIFEDIALKNNIPCEVASAGTSSFHAGEKPDPRSIAVASENGIDISDQRSQELTAKDLDYYDVIFVMDKSNYRDAIALASTNNASKVICRKLTQKDLS